MRFFCERVRSCFHGVPQFFLEIHSRTNCWPGFGCSGSLRCASHINSSLFHRCVITLNFEESSHCLPRLTPIYTHNPHKNGKKTSWSLRLMCTLFSTSFLPSSEAWWVALVAKGGRYGGETWQPPVAAKRSKMLPGGACVWTRQSKIPLISIFIYIYCPVKIEKINRLVLLFLVVKISLLQYGFPEGPRWHRKKLVFPNQLTAGPLLKVKLLVGYVKSHDQIKGAFREWGIHLRCAQ